MTEFFQQQRKPNTPKNNAFFSTEGEGPSLQSYISEHLGRPPEAPEPLSESPSPSIPTAYTNNAPNRRGYHLNNLDVKMGSGLEQYMPTPIMRLRVTKSRLMQEMSLLRMELEKYEHACAQNPSGEMGVRLQSIRERLATLKSHEDTVTAELAQLLRYGPWLGRLLAGWSEARQQWGGLLARVAEKASLLNLLNPGRLERLRLTRQARELQDVLSIRLQDRNTAGEEMAELIQQYDKTLQALDALQQSPVARWASNIRL